MCGCTAYRSCDCGQWVCPSARTVAVVLSLRQPQLLCSSDCSCFQKTRHVTSLNSRDYVLEIPVITYEKAVKEMPQILCKPKALTATQRFTTVWLLRWCLQVVSNHKAYRLRYLWISTLNNCEGKLKEWFRVREILMEFCKREVAKSNDKCRVEVRTSDWQKW